MKRREILMLVPVLALLASATLRAQDARVAEEPRTLRTYPFSDPDPVPILATRPEIYPYFGFDGFSLEGKDQTWNVVRLENPYVRAFIMPSVGGKVWGAVEKQTGKEFIYMNDAVKFRRIALRGPWTSGGIEFNFGIIGHTASTATPVDYALRTNRDGSVTCFVGTLDLPSRTRWSVAITLPRDKAFLRTRAMWYNPTPYDQSYYAWTTAAVSAREDLRYFYNGRFVVPHSNSIANDPWPIDRKGRDLSWYRNNRFDGSKSHFVFGSTNTAFGTYSDNDRMGMGHWARHEDMPGQKVWIWSLFRDGGIWENLLTDTRGQYSEPQAGRLLSQVDHEFFAPGQGDVWDEYWFPVKEIGGLSAASPYAAMYVSLAGDSLIVSVSALQPLSEELTVRNGGSESFRTPVKLKPLETYRKVIPWKGAITTATVQLGDKVSFNGDPKTGELQRPLLYQQPPETSPEVLYLSGEFNEKERQYETALKKYLACLEGEPNHIRALSRVAGLYGRRGEPAKGLPFAMRALAIRKYDPEANFRYGLLARQLAMTADSKEAFGWAARSLEFRSAAYCQLAEIAVCEKSWSAAAEYASAALEYNARNLNASITLALAQRKLGRTKEAASRLDALLAEDPLNHPARFERFFLEETPARLKEINGLIRTELPHETYLESAIRYSRLGCDDEALRILSASPSSVMVRYWSAYLLRSRDTAGSRKELEEANAMPPAFVFPFREESIPVLEWAAASGSWKPSYYLGLLFWGKGRKDDALVRFNSCASPDYPVFFLSRGILRQQMGEKDAGVDFDQALSMDRSSWRAWHYTIASLSQNRKYAHALERAREAAAAIPGNVVLSMDLAGALHSAGKFDECLSVLNGMRVLPYEGSWEGHDLYVRAHLSKALERLEQKDWNSALTALEQSRKFDENLGTGQPDDPDFRLQEYLAAYALDRMGDTVAASEARTRVREYTIRHGVEWGNEHYFGLRALADAGLKEDASRLEKQWRGSAPDDPMLRFYQAQSAGNVQGMLIVRDSNRNDPWFTLRMQALKTTGAVPQLTGTQ